MDFGDLAPAGVAEDLGAGLRRILAPNPSKFTGPGTNSYLIGQGEVTVLDPGPNDPRHLAAILGALAPHERITQILVTHSHRDHTDLVPELRARTGAAVLAFGDSRAGRRADYAGLEGLGGGEGYDRSFQPDILLPDGAEIACGGIGLRAHHTPGHFGNHMCFSTGGDLFVGDLAMGWSSSIVSPPDGDMGDYMASLAAMIALGPARLLPGHGGAVSPAVPRLLELQRHRLAREAQILAALTEGAGTASDLAKRIYVEIGPDLLGPAARNVLAHLLDLTRRGFVRPQSEISQDALWQVVR